MTQPGKYIFAQLITSFALSFLNLGGGIHGSRNLACEMLIAIDEPLYRNVYNESITKTSAMAEEYIKRINQIYQRYLYLAQVNDHSLRHIYTRTHIYIFILYFFLVKSGQRFSCQWKWSKWEIWSNLFSTSGG